MWVCMYVSCFIQWVIILFIYLNLMLKLVQIWPLGVFSKWFLSSFDRPTIFFFLSNFLLSAIIRYSRHIFHFLCSRPRFSPFSKESLFFWVENGIECATYASLRVIMAPTGMANTYIENV